MKPKTNPFLLSVAAFAMSATTHADVVLYQDGFTTSGTNTGGPYTSSLGGTAPSYAAYGLTSNTWTYAGETGGWGQTGSGYATPSSSNYLAFTPVKGFTYTLNSTMGWASDPGGDRWLALAFTQNNGNWGAIGNFLTTTGVGSTSEASLVRTSDATQAYVITLDTTTSDWTNTAGYAYVGWFTANPGAANIGATRLSDFSLTRNFVNSDVVFSAAAAQTVNLTGTNTLTTGGKIQVDTTVGTNLTTITGGTINAPTTETLVIQQDNTSGGLTIASILNGSNGLTKNGAGTATLSGVNTYTGTTTVSAGTLQFAKQSSLYNETPASWTTANINVKSAATLALNVDSAGTSGFTSASLDTLLTNISVADSATAGLQSGAILGFDTSTATGSTFTQGNAITNSTGTNGGAISVTKLGAGTLVFDKTNTYTGTTTVSAGKLALGNALALQNSAFDTASVNGGLDLNGNTTATLGGLTGSVNLSSTLITGYDSLTGLSLNPQTGITSTYSGAITNGSGAMTLTKTGAGTQVLSGANTYSGGTTISSGTLALSGSGTLGATSGTLVINNATLDLGSTTQTVASMTSGNISSNNSGIINGAGTLNVSGNFAYQGYDQNSGAYASNPTFTINSNVDVTGDTLIGRANLNITSGNYTTSRITTNPASADWANLTISGGTVTATNGIDGTYGTNGSNGTSATFALNLNGGTLYTPSIKVADREVSANNDAWLTFNGTTVKATADTTTFITTYGGGNDAHISNGGAIIDTNGHNITIGTTLSNSLGNSGFLTKNGSGTLTLNQSNSYTGGTTVSQGMLVLAANNWILNNVGGTGVTVGSGATLRADNSVANQLNGLTLNGGTVEAINSSGNSDWGNFFLTGNVATTGTSYLNGDIALRANNVDFNVSSSGDTLNIGGVLHAGYQFGSATVSKSGAGTMVITGANTYTGATTVNAGTLSVNGSLASSTTVKNTATLKGNGTLAGTTTIESGGTLAPGNSPGVLTTDTLILNSGSIFEWELDTSKSSPETNRGVAYDAVNANTLTGSGAIFKIALTGTQAFSDTFWDTARTWTDIFKNQDGTSILSNWTDVFKTSGAANFQYSYNGQSAAPTTQGYFTITGTTLTWTAVPEPTSALAGLLITAGLLRRRRAVGSC